jgi:predicted enzyme related to lactoylglutathione lyase
MKYVSALITVNDINASREFYEHVLAQEVIHDFGANVAFKSGLAIHDRAHFAGLIRRDISSMAVQPCNMELYFEHDDLEEVAAVLTSRKIEWLHQIAEQPWCQRVMRFFDPDGHIIEVGESMEAVVRRLHKEGLTVEEINSRTMMPKEFITNTIG